MRSRIRNKQDLVLFRESGRLLECPKPPRPRANRGVVVLDEGGRIYDREPWRLLDHIQDGDCSVHYLDLAGLQAVSLGDFGGSAIFWGGLTKLYASRCGLRSLDGLEALNSIMYLYLDFNNLCENELQRLCRQLPFCSILQVLKILERFWQ